MEGQVIFQVSAAEINAGTMAVLETKYVDKEPAYEVCTVLHVSEAGDWIVEGQNYKGPLLPSQDLGVLSLSNVMEGIFPVVVNQWKRLIKMKFYINDTFEFEPVPFKFAKGHYTNTCNSCTAQFLAAKGQIFCKTCCNKNAGAKINFQLKDKPERKRPRLVQPAVAHDIAMKAYRKGKEGMKHSDVKDWLATQL